MKAGILYLVMVALVLSLGVAASPLESLVEANPGTIYVPGDYPTIQQAVDNAIAGDTIIVRDGTYNENVDVSKRLTIQSENGTANCVVSASNPNDYVFEVTADLVNITGFTIEGAIGYSDFLVNTACTYVVNVTQGGLTYQEKRANVTALEQTCACGSNGMAASFLVVPVPTVEAAVVIDLHLIPDYTDVNVSEPFNIIIQVQANGENATGADVYLDFDTTYLDCLSITPNTTAWPLYWGEGFNNTSGQVDYHGGTTTEPYPTSTFDIVNITFLAQEYGITYINFTFDAPLRFTKVSNGTPGGNVLRNTFNATVYIHAPPTIAFSPPDLTFYAFEGGDNPPDQTLPVWNEGDGSLDWTLFDENTTWLGEQPMSGTSTGPGDTNPVNVSVDIAGLSVGVYYDNITITDPGAINSPQTVPVTLYVYHPPVRTLPPEVLYPGSTFNVIINWTAIDDVDSLLLLDLAPSWWDIVGHNDWCTPWTDVNIVYASGQIEYIWNSAYPVDTAFTAIYEVTVPGGAVPGVYSFSGGILRYYVNATGFNATVVGDTNVTVENAPVANSAAN